MAALNINPTVFETEGGRKYLGSVYNLLQNIEPLYLKYRETQQMQCYVKHSETESGTYFRFGAYQLVVDYVPAVTGKPVTAGVIFELDQDRFLVAGSPLGLSQRAFMWSCISIESSGGDCRWI